MAGWVTLLLAKMGAPSNPVTRIALYDWAASEGMPASEHNWLATTIDCCGGQSVNSAGVKSYPTESDGVQATWNTLKFPAYANVVAEFRKGKSLDAIYQAINASPWCAGCQGGNYPIALFNALAHGGSGVPPGSGTGPGGRTPVPVVPAETTRNDWSGHVRRSADQFLHVGHALHRYSQAIGSIR